VKKWVTPSTIGCFFGLFLLLGAAYAYHWHGYQKTQVQPIAFNHTLHSNKLNLHCTYCHIYTEKENQAGIPQSQMCMECHKDIKLESLEIQRLHQYWKQSQPIPWMRIYRLPDFVSFSHKRHGEKGVECIECHGNVSWMHEMRQIASLQEDWCIACHTSRGTPQDCSTCHKLP